MKKFMYLLMTALLLLTISGCADCNHESDYDYVGVSVEQYTTKAKILSSIAGINLCNNSQNQNCTVTQSGITNFAITCKNPTNYNFNLKDSIHKLFPMEAYKDDKFEQCEDYYVYDFLSTSPIPKPEYPARLGKVSIDNTNPNFWYVTIEGSCYKWDMTNSLYKVPVTPVP